MAVHTKIRIITSLHVVAALLLVLANAGLTSATTIAEDDFNSYSDGFLVGQPGGGVGWERDWRNILEGTIVTNGHIQLDEATRVIRDLETPIGDTASDYGKTMDEFMDEIQGRLPSGDWIVGVEVFRRLYSAVGLVPIVWITRLPLISHGLEFLYRVFAKNRLRLTGRCTAESCEVGSSQS